MKRRAPLLPLDVLRGPFCWRIRRELTQRDVDLARKIDPRPEALRSNSTIIKVLENEFGVDCLRPADWKPAINLTADEIKAALWQKGITLGAIARENGIDRRKLSSALNAAEIEQCWDAIAKFLGLPPHEIWPSRYHANGTRIRLRAQSESERAAA